MTIKKSSLRIAILILVFIFYGVALNYFLYYSPEFDWVDQVLTQAVSVGFIYIIYRLGFGGRTTVKFTVWTVLKIFLCLGLFLGFYYLYYHYIIIFLGHGLYYKNMPLRLFFTYSLDLFTKLLIYGSAVWYFERTITVQRKLRINERDRLNLEKKNLELENDKLALQSQNLQLQNEKLKIQYDFLKAQINPHFLYNTLSFFYSKTIANDRQTAEGIALLTDIMRYSLQQGGTDGKVALEDEVTHLANYMQLQQMRFNNTLNVLFDNTVDPAGCRILPHIFITLVENAFKHGEVNNPLHPLTVSLAIQDSDMVFLVKNKIRNGPSDSNTTGVGLNNIRNRIKMEYGGLAKLENNIKDNYFTVVFTVPMTLVRDVPAAPENDTVPAMSITH